LRVQNSYQILDVTKFCQNLRNGGLNEIKSENNTDPIGLVHGASSNIVLQLCTRPTEFSIVLKNVQ
jgi:hypothetical protein